MSAATPPMEEWLLVLKGQLAILGTDAIALLEGVDDHTRPLQWCDQVPAEVGVVAATNGWRTGVCGWLLRTPSGDPVRHLFLATTEQMALDDPRMVLGQAVCRLALSLRQEQDSRLALTRQPVHALRNGLNGVAMTAAVLNSGGLPATLQPFVEDLQEAVQRCLQALTQLAVLIEPQARWPDASVNSPSASLPA